MIDDVSPDKEAEYMASIKTALEWQQQETMAYADAARYLQQAANGEVPHD